MPKGQIVFYDYEHCRSFLEQRARDLREQTTGLEALATFRELIYGFSYEALEQCSLILGQFDTGVVFLFTPAELSPDEYPKGHEIARKKAIDMLGASEPPLVLEMLSAQSERETLSSKGFMEKWMRPEFLVDVLLARRVAVQLLFDGGAFFAEVLRPQLESHGFKLLASYVDCAEEGVLRVEHPGKQGTIFKLPWVAWIREMLGGGYNVVYVLACFATYLKKLDEAVM